MARTIYSNGTILTVDASDTAAEAVLVEGGKIIATGTLAEVEVKAGSDVDHRDLAGCTMIPAFIDPHGHFPDSGYLGMNRADLSGFPVGDCASLEEACGRLRALAAKTEPGSWVMGSLYDPSSFPENRLPTRRELDAISTEHPILVMHFTGHAAAVNTLGLEARGIDSEATDPPGAWYGRFENTGELDGSLNGMTAIGELGDSEFQVSYADFRKAFSNAAREYHAQGVSLAQNAWANETLLSYFLQIGLEDTPEIDCVVLPAAELEPDYTEGRLGLPPEDPARRIMIGPRKLFGDGSFHVQNACITQPYHRPFNRDPGYCCPPSITKSGMVARIDPLHTAGYQVHIHCNGDATADILLDAFEDVQERHPRDDHRHTLIHTQILREDQLDRMVRLGISASFFPAHLYYWGDFHRDVTFGPERIKNMSPLRWAVNHGVRFTIHNDAQVTPTKPLHLMWCAVNRMSHTGRVLGIEQALTPREALRAHTIDAAWQVFLDHERGSIEPGKRADLAILSANPLDDPVAIRDITVEETIIRGETVYQRETA